MDRETTSVDVLELLRVLASAGITVWLDGGWGIDALLQTQTRPHKDVDIIPRVADIPKLLEILRGREFAIQEGTPPHAFVLANGQGLAIDIHAVTFAEDGNGIHRMDNGGDWIFRAEAFTGRGVIDGVNVHCLSPLAQVQCHAQGYPPTEKDLHDMERLQQRFNIELPVVLRRNAAAPNSRHSEMHQ